jgi:hypothetical protein
MRIAVKELSHAGRFTIAAVCEDIMNDVEYFIARPMFTV